VTTTPFLSPGLVAAPQRFTAQRVGQPGSYGGAHGSHGAPGAHGAPPVQGSVPAVVPLAFPAAQGFAAPSITVDLSTAPTARDLVAHAEVVAIPAVDGDPLPDGAVQLAWLDNNGYGQRADVVKWWRLDRSDLKTGQVVRVDVQARQRRHMSSPPHHLTASLVVTGKTSDEARVMIGNPDRQGSWAYGVVFNGAILVAAEVPPGSESPNGSPAGR
jgi:hypothetical protein